MPARVEHESLEQRFRDLERRIGTMETASRLASSAIQEGALEILDAAGLVVATFGKLSDDPDYGLSVVDGGIYVGGGPVRALDVAQGDSPRQQRRNLDLAHRRHVPHPSPAGMGDRRARLRGRPCPDHERRRRHDPVDAQDQRRRSGP